MNKEISELIKKKIRLLIKEEDIEYEANQIILKILKDIADSRYFLYYGKNPELKYMEFRIFIYDCNDPNKLDEIVELVKTINKRIDEYATFVHNNATENENKSNNCNCMTYARYLKQVLKSKGLGEGLSSIRSTVFRMHDSDGTHTDIDLAVIKVDLEVFLDKEVELLGEEKDK